MASESEFWGRPFEPGPVRVDPNANPARAKVVRDALHFLATDPECCSTLPGIDRQLAWDMARHCDDRTLAKLGRLLK